MKLASTVSQITFKIKALLASLCMIVLIGCESASIKQPASEVAKTVTLDDIAQQIESARTLDAPERARQLIAAAAQLVNFQEYDWARNILSMINDEQLALNDFQHYAIVFGKIALVEGNQPLLQRHLWDTRLVASHNEMPTTLRIDYHELRATALFDRNEYSNSINERIQLSQILTDASLRLRNDDLLWYTLMQIGLEQLEQLSLVEQNYIKKGWLELAVISKNNKSNINKQIAQIDEWMRLWFDHPASSELPADLLLLRDLAQHQAKKVALLLPLSGRLSQPAQAIQDGFMAAFFQSQQVNQAAPEVMIFDTTNYNSISELYNSVANEGVDIIVGPLDRARVNALCNHGEILIPVLALNHCEENQNHVDDLETDISTTTLAPPFKQTTNNVFQFALNVEDEATQLAEQAWRDGHRRAMVIAPNSNWGDRSTSAFSKRWLALGGSVTHDYRFADQRGYSNLIKDAMQVTDSQTRKRDVQRALGISVEFEPRRRKDIDFIYLAANANQARQLKPTLAFHFAGAIPVYSTSQVFDGNTTVSNSDLNEIVFTTIPWHFDNQLTEKHAILSAQPHARYANLYALGVDAYYLLPRLTQLETIERSRYYGSTGILRVTQDKKIFREQTWAKIKSGTPVKLTNATK